MDLTEGNKLRPKHNGLQLYTCKTCRPLTTINIQKKSEIDKFNQKNKCLAELHLQLKSTTFHHNLRLSSNLKNGTGSKIYWHEYVKPNLLYYHAIFKRVCSNGASKKIKRTLCFH